MTVDVLPRGGAAHAATGVALLADGRFQDALAPLRLALACGDARPATLLNLAIAEDRAGDRGYARTLMRSVAIRLPDWDEPLLRLAESYRAADDMAQAENAYRQVLALNPVRPEALIALGGLLLRHGQAEEARDLLLRGCGVAPGDAGAWNALGMAFLATGDPKRALTAFVRAQALQPTTPEYVLNGVRVAVEAGEAEAELARLTVAGEQDPLNPAVQLGRGMLLERLGRRPEAIDALEAAAALAPDAVTPLSLLAPLLCQSNRTQAAETALRRLLDLAPDNPWTRNDLGAVLLRRHRHVEAQALLQEAADAIGPHSMVLSNLANTTVYLGLQAEAVALAWQAVKCGPESVPARRALCNILPYRDATTGAELLAAARDCAARLPRTPFPPFANTAEPERPLTVGLLSGSLRSHPVGWLTVAGIETLDPRAFSVVCLSQRTAATDPLARRFRALARDWLDIDTLSDIALAEAARDRGIDILLDLGGYGDGGRITACANRLAPVQIKWVGMQSHTTGLAEMDWFLTDRWETPDGFEPLYSERLLRLADGYVCYSPPPHAPDVVPLPALANGHVTFGCFNNLAKITPRVIDTWAAILRRIPDARLVLKTQQLSETTTADRLRAAFADHGIVAHRLDLRGPSGHRTFLGEYGDIDIVLDPFPYSGGLTTCEALWMGVPTITLPGDFFASRHSVSHMSNAGLADWVADSPEAYVAMAVARAADIPALASLRAGLREQVRRSPLCDAPRFGRNLGAALRHAWRAWCREGNGSVPGSRNDGTARQAAPAEAGA
jgi:predicted O-linked N-acetylglucosamine transferase (SPINDLY family)